MPVAAPPSLPDTALRADLLDTLQSRRERLLCQAMRVLGNRDQAEDVLQEAALRCLDCPLRREQIARPQAWLGCMVRNLAIDQYRRTKRQPGAEPVTELPCPQADPERLLLDRQRLDLLEQGLARVPDRDRSIFLDHRLGGIRQRDLATREGLSPARINAIIARVHAQLQDVLEPQRPEH
ncbi:sigma-70 family RNA polymerase sigma factor [Thioclava sp. GXIMD2076]|uniref:Sigma-70 family RNA polymerase sigma factor n=1 Tax=Thioclava kandeliae TaxID=3070818 RepID=A0ABV1SJB6_9RHOB